MVSSDFEWLRVVMSGYRVVMSGYGVVMSSYEWL